MHPPPPDSTYLWITLYRDVCLDIASTVRQILLTSGISLYFIGRSSVNTSIPSPKIGAFQIGPKTQIGDLFENGSDDFIKFQQFMETTFTKKLRENENNFGSPNAKCHFSRNRLYWPDRFHCCSVCSTQQWNAVQQ
jgi:hypothetical protein